MIIAETIGFDFSTSGMTMPLLIAAGLAVIGYLLITKKQAEQPQATGVASSLAGLFSGSRLTILASLAALAMQAGSVRDLAKKLLAKIIEFADKETPKVDDAKPIEEKK